MWRFVAAAQGEVVGKGREGKEEKGKVRGRQIKH